MSSSSYVHRVDSMGSMSNNVGSYDSDVDDKLSTINISDDSCIIEDAPVGNGNNDNDDTSLSHNYNDNNDDENEDDDDETAKAINYYEDVSDDDVFDDNNIEFDYVGSIRSVPPPPERFFGSPLTLRYMYQVDQYEKIRHIVREILNCMN